MSEEILMPKLGNSVESCIIVEWNVKENDIVSEGDLLCVVETDKATVDVESTKSGTILDILYKEGDEVPVFTPIAVIGEPGEKITQKDTQEVVQNKIQKDVHKIEQLENSVDFPARIEQDVKKGISPRAKKKADKKNVDIHTLTGSGPHGRIIEQDVTAAITSGPSISPAAYDSAKKQDSRIPVQGSGIGGRILSSDISVKGIRKVIAETMHRSLSTTAQYTIHSSADARALLALRQKFKESDPELGLRGITINDSILFALSRTLLSFPDINAHFLGDTIKTFSTVDLGVAVDTPRGLLVPVLRSVETLSLKQLSKKTRDMYRRVDENTVSPDDLTGSTFTVTNLGTLGVEWFTPVLNIPEVAILGVCSIEQKPVLEAGEIKHIPFIGLSLTVNHQAVDGAPAAAFLQKLCKMIKEIDIITAV